MVKRIITSTAGDLDDPSYEQGAGLINSYRAVLAAKSWGVAVKTGDALLSAPADATVTGMPRSKHALSFSVTNDGASPETVSPLARRLGTTVTSAKAIVDLKSISISSTQVKCAVDYPFGFTHYCAPEQTVRIPVAKGVDRLEVNAVWNVVKEPFGDVTVRLVDPAGQYAGTTEPSDLGPPFTTSGFGHVDVAHPTPGTWQAQVLEFGFCGGGALSCAQPAAPLYSGPVTLRITTSRFSPIGNVSPASKVISPGQTAQFTLNTMLPSQSGDTSADIVVDGKSAKGAPTSAGIIPVIMRTLVPTSRTGGSFFGSFLGGNGDLSGLWSTTYEFHVPSGLTNLALGVSVTDGGNNLQGVLVDPEGYAVNVQSTVNGYDTNPNSTGFGLPNSYGKGMQFFQVNPPPGIWRFVLEINHNISGALTATPFRGAISFNPARVSATSVPNNSGTGLLAGQAHVATIKITNNGVATKMYSVDARLATQVGFTLSTQVHLPLDQAPFDSSPEILVPPESQGLVVGAESLNTSKTSTQPIMVEAGDLDGAAPSGLGADPDLVSTPNFNPATSDWTAGLSFTSSYELPMGIYQLTPGGIGPFPNGEPKSVAAVGVILQTDDFDSGVKSSTGDIWTALAFGAQTYNPLILAPGRSGTIQVRIKPNQSSGSTVRGTLFVDTFAALRGFPFANLTTAITWSGDEVAAIPYAYKVK